jgi:hypothetical protein
VKKAAVSNMNIVAKGVAVPAPNGLRGASAGLAQLVEHLICNQGVAGSNPATGTITSLENSA